MLSLRLYSAYDVHTWIFKYIIERGVLRPVGKEKHCLWVQGWGCVFAYSFVGWFLADWGYHPLPRVNKAFGSNDDVYCTIEVNNMEATQTKSYMSFGVGVG